ncbi:MAG: hypothetical protein ACODAU_02990 [Myxococcota bacterium]
MHSTIPPRRFDFADDDRRVLVVEPMDDLRELVVRGMARRGLKAVGCRTAADASAALLAAEVSVVVVAHHVRRSPVHELQELRRRTAPPTVVLSTGGTSEEALQEQLGNFACLLLKPVAIDDVIACVRLALADEMSTGTHPAFPSEGADDGMEASG